MARVIDENLVAFIKAEKERLSIRYDELDQDIDGERMIARIKLSEIVMLDRCLNCHINNPNTLWDMGETP